MKWNCMLLVLVTFLIGGVATADAQSEFAATLSGTEEVPAVGTIAFGTATFDVNFSEGTLGMNFHLSATNLKQAFMAHVHCAPAGDNGPIVLWLAGRPSPPGTATYNLNGPWIGSAELGDANVTPNTSCTNAAGANVVVNTLVDVLRLMAEGSTYVNIHSVANPSGEIRGQIDLVGPFTIP